jgi:lipopolysaccharide export system protein LptA
MSRHVLAPALGAALALFPQLSSAQDRSTAHDSYQWKPLVIDARSVSVNDRDQTATFSDAIVTQGTVNMRRTSLIIHYYSAGPSHRGGIDRIECVSDYLHLIDQR